MKPSVKYLAIYRHKDSYPIKNMCDFFEVSRSGYYDYLKRMNKPSHYESLAILIEDCQKKCKKTYGYRRVQIWLSRNKNITLNPKTVLRVMNKYNLLSVIRQKNKFKFMGENLYKFENLLNREFAADAPNLKWVTDVSYIHTKQGNLYLSMIRDLYDNSIVAYKVGTEQNVNLILDTVRHAIKKESFGTELKLHSDQGCQYTSHGYYSLLKEHNILPSMSRRANCYDNAMAENFFSIIKSECINRQKIKTYEEARYLIDEYIWFYNNERIQTKTKLTPLEKRRQFA